VNVTSVAGSDGVLLRAAMGLAGRGWRVFPCAPGGKRPALRGNWQDRATTDHGQLHAWWADAPYNIGVACGPGLVVVDLDVTPARRSRSEPGSMDAATGEGVLAALCDQHGQPYPPPTYAVGTPSGGRHLYYLAPPGSRVRNSAGWLGPLIDIRADGGYVIGAGSSIAGHAYTVLDQRPPAPLPGWLADLLVGAPASTPAGRAGPVPEGADGIAYAMAALREEARRVATAQPGTRNDTLNRAAFSLGQLAAAGLLPPLGVATVLGEAARRAGLPEDEARRTITSGMAGGARKPRTSGAG
jgi:hypothetical protein